MKQLKLVLSFFVLSLLAACNLPLSQNTPLAEVDGKINTWIDAPLDGAEIPLAEYELILHANAPEGIQKLTLTINDTPVQVDGLTAGERMSEIHYRWLPPEAGKYRIFAQSTDLNGQSDEGTQVEVFVVGAAETTQAPSQTTAAPTEALPSFTASPSATQTITPSPTPAALLARLTVSPQAVYNGNCGENQLSFSALVNDAANMHSLLLFVRLRDAASGEQSGWNSGYAMNPSTQAGLFVYGLAVSSIPQINDFDAALLEYQFVGTNAAGEVIGRSPTFADVTVNQCGIIIPVSTIPPQFTIMPLYTPTATPVIVK